METVTETKAKSMSKSELLTTLAKATSLTKTQVHSVFDELTKVIENQLGKHGPGVFNFVGLCKMVRVHKPATKERKGKNPFTGEEKVFKAKPATNVVKVKALKNLKSMM